MEPQVSPQEFREHYENLPPELQEAIFSEATAQKIEHIANRNNAARHVSEIARLTGRVLLGILPPNRLINALAEHLDIDKQTASDVAQDINREIFFPVREDLKELYGITSVEQAPVARDQRPMEPTPPRESFRQAQPSQTQQPPPKADQPRAEEPPQQPPSTEPPKEKPSSLAEAIEERKGPPSNLPSLSTGSPPTPVGADKYREPIKSGDTQNLPPQSPEPKQQGPKIEGNVINLKDIDVE